MPLDPIRTSFTGTDEHDKFVSEIYRKYSLLEQLYNVVSDCSDKIDENTGYNHLVDMVGDLKGVKTELETIAIDMQTAVDKLNS